MNNPLLSEVLVRPSTDNLNSLANQQSDPGSLGGKFIRIGSMVLVAPYGKVRATEDALPTSVYHIDMVVGALFHPDQEIRSYAREIRSIGDKYPEQSLNESHPVHDAGHFLYIVRNAMLCVGGASEVFGKAQEKGRQITIDLAQHAVNSEIEVISE